MAYEAKILADSVSPAGHRVTSLLATFPRFLLAEWNTHRVLSRNSASSRAIPVEKRVSQVLENPFVPEAFGKNQRGMQAEANIEGVEASAARNAWLAAAEAAAHHAKGLASVGVHKQHANRLLEPFVWHTVVVTSTEWDNWDALRVSKMAQPEMYKIAGLMREVRLGSTPLTLGYDEWHLPFVRGNETPFLQEEFELRVRGIDPVKVCIGRCAAVSFLRQEDTTAEKATLIYDKLRSDGHMSPFEHACRPMTDGELDLFAQRQCEWDSERKAWNTGRLRHFLGNVEGWVQARKMIPGEDVYRGE